MKRIAFFGGSFDPPHRGHLAVARAAADDFALDAVLFAPVGRQPLKNRQDPTPFIHRYAMTTLATQADARFVPSLADAPRGESPGSRPNYTPNYTVDTLQEIHADLRRRGEPYHLFTLLGADSWLDIARWRRASELLTLCDWIVAARPGFSLSEAAAALPPEVRFEQEEDARGRRLILHPGADGRPGGSASATCVWFLAHTQENISATELRAALRALDAEPANLPPPNATAPSPRPQAPPGFAELLPPGVLAYLRKTRLYCSPGAPNPVDAEQIPGTV